MNILHLEDDRHLLDIMETAIKAFIRRADIHQFVNSNQAVEFIEQAHRTVDIYILDIRVQGELNGIEVARSIRQVDPYTPIIITSAYQKPPRQVLSTLQSRWMEKPWYVLDAPKTILSLVEEASRAAEKRTQQPGELKQMNARFNGNNS
jgi:DNA-binding NtrC family response regulator